VHLNEPMIKNQKINMKYHILFAILLQSVNCFISNAAIGILTKSNVYLAEILEFNSTNDYFHLIYHHSDPIYPLQSFTANHLLHRIYICSPNTIYYIDLTSDFRIHPLAPVDDTPCRTGLTYIPSRTVLLWALRNQIIQLDFPYLNKDFLWNTSSTIVQIISNETIEHNYIHFYVSFQQSILHCQATYEFSRINPFQSCTYLDSNYHEISTLAIDNNLLYVADRLQHRIYVLTISSDYTLINRRLLPLNTSTIADIQSMFIYDHYLVWLTTSGHIRIVSLITYEVRNVFWFDEELRSIHLVSFSQLPNQTTTERSSTLTSRSSNFSTSASEQIATTSTTSNSSNPWKTTTYITSITLGIALFISAGLISCVLLNHRLRNVVPHSFTNIFHILHHRTASTRQSLSNELSM